VPLSSWLWVKACDWPSRRSCATFRNSSATPPLVSPAAVVSKWGTALNTKYGMTETWRVLLLNYAAGCTFLAVKNGSIRACFSDAFAKWFRRPTFSLVVSVRMELSDFHRKDCQEILYLNFLLKIFRHLPLLDHVWQNTRLIQKVSTASLWKKSSKVSYKILLLSDSAFFKLFFHIFAAINEVLIVAGHKFLYTLLIECGRLRC